MMFVHQFGAARENQCYLKEEELDAAIEAVAKALKSGLPEKAHRVDVLNFALDEAKDHIKTRRVNL